MIAVHIKKIGILRFSGILFFLTLLAAQAESQVVRMNEAADANGRYATSMIKLALSYIDTPYRLEMVPGEITQARNVDEVVSGRLDIMWAATDQDMEKLMLPVRIPLYKGLLGHRIFIIHRDNQAKFDRVRTFDDLRSFTFGQGATWADAKILEANGLKVVRANKYPSLFYMVDGGRFDAFPRGVQEPWGEIAQRPQLELAVEKRLMLVYRMPFYLFVGKDDVQLAADLEKGLRMAIADGKFDEIFYKDPTVKSVLEKVNLSERVVFQLENPTLPQETPVDDPTLWLDVKDL
jgi:hypothetical protein